LKFDIVNELNKNKNYDKISNENELLKTGIIEELNKSVM
jgi:hypothetical protein